MPGPPLSWIGLLILYTTPDIPFDYTLLSITFVITLIIAILDYVIPAQGTKRFGGSKYGIWGTNIGLIVGIFAPIPFGFIIGPFVGAFIGELIFNQSDSKFIYWLYRFIVYEICVLYGFVRNLYSHRLEVLECLVLIDHYFYRQFKNENALLFHCVHPSLGLTFIILQAEQVIS